MTYLCRKTSGMTTQVHLHRLDGDYHLQAVNQHGLSVETDASADIGGTGKGMRPMEMLLSAVGACTAIDVILIMKKKRQNLRDIRIRVTGEREDKAIPAIFHSIHVHFDLYGEVDPAKAEHAIRMSQEKYCSVTHMVNKVAQMTWSFEVHP